MLFRSGVHVGQSDLSVREVRNELGEDVIIGASARTIDMARKALEDGADYIGVGAVFGTTTKGDAKTISPQILSDICHAVDIPVVAIGGVKETNIK